MRLTINFSPQFQFVIQEACDENRQQRQLKGVFPDFKTKFLKLGYKYT